MNNSLRTFLTLLLLFGFIQPSHALTLINGGSVPGTISVAGGIDTYTFTATAGDSIQLSITGYIGMFMNLYEPNGTHIGTNNGDVITKSLTQGGTYTLEVSASDSNQTGNYDLYFVKVPGANEYGLLNIGGVVTGTIAPGDLDSYTFVANAGDSIQLSISGDIGMFMNLYAPDGSKAGGPNSSTISKNLTLSGTYTVITRSSTAFETGNYQLTFNRTCSVMGDVAPVSATDCEVNAADLLIMTRIVLGLISPSAHQLINGDLYPPGSPDGVIDIRDLIFLTQMLLQ